MPTWQSQDLRALDGAWLELAGSAEFGVRNAESPGTTFDPDHSALRTSHSALQRAWIERPRGHSKTFDMAVQVAWILLFAETKVAGLVAACDLEQARFALDALKRLAAANPVDVGERLVFRKDAVTNPATGSVVRVISSDVNSSFGALPDFVVCDELCHWEWPELWHSLVSSAAKKPRSVLTVLTNAGVGRGWQWEARETARTSTHWYFSSLVGCRATWIEPRWLDEQRSLLPGPVYARLWENRWQHSDGGFVTLAEAEACRDETLVEQREGTRGVTYVAGVDYAEKHDHTVGVVAHHDGTRIVVDRMDVVVPSPDRPTPVAWVERWIESIARDFGRVTFVVDPYQLVGVVQWFEGTHDVRRFEFAAGRGNHELATTLRRLILNREVAWYPNCGAVGWAVPTNAGSGGFGESNDVRGWHSPPYRDDLETELASLLLKQSASGRVRLDHHRDGVHHDDRAFTLGVACLHLVRDRRPAEWMTTTAPIDDGFAW